MTTDEDFISNTPMSKHERAALEIALSSFSGIASAAALHGEAITRLGGGSDFIPQDVEIHYHSEWKTFTVHRSPRNYWVGTSASALLQNASALKVANLMASGSYNVEEIYIDGERVF